MTFREELSPTEKLYEMIEKVIIVKGEIPTDPTVWEFYISDKIIKVDAEHLITPSVFNKQFLKIFDHPAPKINTSKWSDLLDALSEEKAEYRQEMEESGSVFTARAVFEIICNRECTENADDAISQELLLMYVKDNNTYYAMRSDIIKRLVDGAGFSIPLNELSSTMSLLGLKKEGTYHVRYNGLQKRSWLFNPDAVLAARGE
jgi:hypothetical protein